MNYLLSVRFRSIGPQTPMVLFTSTAPWLYQKFGYEPVNRPDYTWTIARPDIYLNKE